MTSNNSSCAEPSYTPPKGLQFSLYCDLDRPGVGDIDDVGADNAEDCMNQCSMHPNQACGAAMFNSTARKCFFKTKHYHRSRRRHTRRIDSRNRKQNTIPAITNRMFQQWRQPSDFEWTRITVYCEQTVGGLDVCHDSSPEYRAHTESLDECLEACSTLDSLCTGVTWDPLLTYGYLNYYPKNTTARIFDNTRVSAGDGLRAAKALLDTPTDDCLAAVSGTLVASKKDSLELSCGEDRPGNNFTARHAGSSRFEGK